MLHFSFFVFHMCFPWILHRGCCYLIWLLANLCLQILDGSLVVFLSCFLTQFQLLETITCRLHKLAQNLFKLRRFPLLEILCRPLSTVVVKFVAPLQIWVYLPSIIVCVWKGINSFESSPCSWPIQTCLKECIHRIQNVIQNTN